MLLSLFVPTTNTMSDNTGVNNIYAGANLHHFLGGQGGSISGYSRGMEYVIICLHIIRVPLAPTHRSLVSVSGWIFRSLDF